MPTSSRMRGSRAFHGSVGLMDTPYTTIVNVPAIQKVALTACFSGLLKIGSQVLCLPMRTKFALQSGSIAGYTNSSNLWPTDRLMPIVRKQPARMREHSDGLPGSRLALRVLAASLQVSQLASVVADRHRVGHDPKKIVHDTQKVVGCYHLFVLRACCFLSRCLQRRDSFARHQARYAPRKPASLFLSPLLFSRPPRYAFRRQIHATNGETTRIDQPGITSPINLSQRLFTPVYGQT